MSARGQQGNAGRWIAIVAGIVVLATVVAAIVVMGPPSQQRLQRLDERRIADLGRIQLAVQSYRNMHDGLPVSLAALAEKPGMRLSIVDPASGEPYGYEPTGDSGYRLCARFATDTANAMDAAQTWPPGGWDHAAGRQCFERRVDPIGK